MIRTWLDLVSRSMRREGPTGMLRRIPTYIARQRGLRQFDRRYGTRTTQVRPIRNDEVVAAGATRSSTHMPTPEEHWERMMRALPVRLEEFSFVDIGSGSGRVVLYASRLPFKRVVGVEFSRPLHEQAVANVEIFHRHHAAMSPVELVCADAITYELPAEDTVLFFHQPFDGQTFERMMASVARSLAAAPRCIVVVYYEPRHQHEIEASGLFRLIVSEGELGDLGVWRIWRTRPELERASVRD